MKDTIINPGTVPAVLAGCQCAVTTILGERTVIRCITCPLHGDGEHIALHLYDANGLTRCGLLIHRDIPIQRVTTIGPFPGGLDNPEYDRVTCRVCRYGRRSPD